MRVVHCALVIALASPSATTAFVAPVQRPAFRPFALASSTADVDVRSGRVKWFNEEKGFGFIEPDDGGGDIFVHVSGVETGELLKEGDSVDFALEVNEEAGKQKAVGVKYAQEVQQAGEGLVSMEMDLGDIPDAAEQRRQEAEELAAAQAAQSVDYDSAARMAYEAAGSEGDFDSFKAQYLADTSKMVGAKQEARNAADLEATKAAEAAAAAKKAEEEGAAAEAAAKQAEEEARIKAEAEAAAEAAAAAKKIEEERLAAEAAAKQAEEEARIKAEAEAAAAEAKRLEEERVAKEAAEAAAAEAKRLEEEEGSAIALGYPSAAAMKARQQPKSADEEAALAAKYAALELGERAFQILVDLQMIELNDDPDDPNRDRSKDDEDI